MKIFYSWQSDIEGKINRYFIHDAIKNAVKNLNDTGTFNIIIDQATRDEPGTPDIPNTILKKIDECSLFIADITFINEEGAKRRTPNPNVLLELGYAIKKLGFEKIITILNCEYGKCEELPFDLRHRRPLQYQYNSNMEKAATLKILSKEIENAILLIDKKTISDRKIDFIIYDKDDGKPIGANCTINGTFHKRITEDDFIRGMDFNELRKYKGEKTLTGWQEYLFKQVKEHEEMKMAYKATKGMAITSAFAFVDQYETKNYYDKYMATALIRTNAIRLDFLTKNNNEQSIKNVKIVLKTKKNDGVRRKSDFPDYPSSSILTAMTVRLTEVVKQCVFTKKEYGEYDIFEYEKDNLYATEEYILEEPLYLVCEEGLIEIEYTIYSDNLAPINGTLTIEVKMEAKALTPMEAFYEL